MIDKIKIHARAGNGGNGIVSFRREKYVPLGGPDGGDGGSGGSVYLEGDRSVATLKGFQSGKLYKAASGARGGGQNMHGKSGTDLVLKVPLGTLVRKETDEGKEVLIGDIVESGQRLLIASGGKGGLGNSHFASPTNRAPRIAQKGSKGEEAYIVLDLKIMADVGITGYPNVGKSTLLNAVTKAKPKIADYPFTTLEPIIGVVDLGYDRFVLADIPGLIEGAHSGAGLGLDFLRHIERTKVIIHLLDGCSENPALDLKKVEKEMDLYGAGILKKERLVVVNKIDIPDVRERIPIIKNKLEKEGVKEVYFISGISGEGTKEVMARAFELVSAEKYKGHKADPQEEYRVFRPSSVHYKK